MSKSRLLVVDDERLNLEILIEALTDAGYELVSASNGIDALAALTAAPDRFDAVLLDRMMPGMNGLEVLKRMKEDEKLAFVPVILQTARAATEDIREGLEAGAYYYLCKPFDDATMLAVVKTAVGDCQRYRSVRRQVELADQALRQSTQIDFEIRTLDEAKGIASLLAELLPNGRRLGIGLMELLINGIEHGNLGIAYKTKSELLASDSWLQEVERRMALPENVDKRVHLSVQRSPEEIVFSVRDQGTGFDWPSYMDISPARAFDSHGRGIAMARMLSFTSIEYRGCGNEVVARFTIPVEAADNPAAEISDKAA
jgi:phosphoserine phosphatase RsbU/P